MSKSARITGNEFDSYAHAANSAMRGLGKAVADSASGPQAAAARQAARLARAIPSKQSRNH